MNEWASKILSVFPADRAKADLDQFIMEVNNDQAEQMYFHRELDEELECRPTFDQLSIERIFDEAQKNLTALKSLESIVSERLNAYTVLHNNSLKVKSAFECFESFDGSLKMALDSFFLYNEQESQQYRQQQVLTDLKKSISEMRSDAQRRVNEYQRELSSAEKDVASAEKKLSKAKEQLEKGIELRSKLESFELDVLLPGNRVGKVNNTGGTRDPKQDAKLRENEDYIGKFEKEIKEEARNIMKALAHRDSISSAARRAFQKLDHECKHVMFLTLKKILDKELESSESKNMVLEKFSSTINTVSIETDINSFIEKHIDEGGALEYGSQALSLLTDLAPKTAANSGTSAAPPSSTLTSPNSSSYTSPFSPSSESRRPSLQVAHTSPRPSVISSSSSSAAPATWEFTAYLSQIFYTAGSTVGGNEKGELSPEEQSSVKDMHRKARITNNQLKFHDVKTLTAQEVLNIESNTTMCEAVDWLCNAVKTQKGRDEFISELNQFRSRKVDVGSGFDALGVVLWHALLRCQSENDVHTAKVIMMLSQTFFRMRPKDQILVSADPHTSVSSTRTQDEDDEDEDGNAKRGVEYRQYIKEKLMGHPIWQDGNYWEQALWQCAIEQLQTIPMEKPWYDMDREGRTMSIRRVHEVIFSQVMAIIHSMLELGCPKSQCREFLYRMCVIHQLNESHRQQLLAHVFRSHPVNTDHSNNNTTNSEAEHIESV